MNLKEEIEAIILHEHENPSTNMGNEINTAVFLSEGVDLDQPLIDALNDHDNFTDYADFVRWVWKKVKEAARWLWDKLFGED